MIEFNADEIFILTSERKIEIVEELINSDRQEDRDLGVVVQNDLPVGSKIVTSYLGVCEDPSAPDLGEMIAIMEMHFDLEGVYK